jgi:hypothetical protein
VRAAGLDASDDGHLWQTVFFAAQRASAASAPAPASGRPRPAAGLNGPRSG